MTLVKICFSCIFIKARKNTFELVGTVLKAVKKNVRNAFETFVAVLAVFNLLRILGQNNWNDA